MAERLCFPTMAHVEGSVLVHHDCSRGAWRSNRAVAGATYLEASAGDGIAVGTDYIQILAAKESSEP